MGWAIYTACKNLLKMFLYDGWGINLTGLRRGHLHGNVIKKVSPEANSVSVAFLHLVHL